MFTKLLKYAFQSQRKLLGGLSLAALGLGMLGGLAVALLTAFVEKTPDPEAGELGMALMGLFMVGILLSVVVYVVAVWILLLYRFYKHHFSQEGYLTFTLPVTTHQLLLSAMVNMALWTLISGAVALAAGAMVLAPMILGLIREGAMALPLLVEELEYAFSFMPEYPWGLQLAAMVIEGLYALVVPLVCISIGCVITKKYRLITAFAIYYGLLMVFSMVTGVFTVVMSVTGAAWDGDGTGFLALSLAVPAALQLGITVGGYFLMHRMLSKKLNLL